MKRILTFAALGFATACFGQVPDYVPTDGLVAWYPFDGNVEDQSGNGFDAGGSELGANNFSSNRLGVPSTALSLAPGQFVQCPNWFASSSSQTEWTMAIWIQSDAQASPHVELIMGHRAHFKDKLIQVLNDSLFVGNARISTPLNYSTVANLAATDTVWHLLAMTNSDEQLKLFVDGVLVQEVERAGEADNWTDSYYGTYIGGNGHDPSWSNTFLGNLDDAGIWNRTLSDLEIQELYSAELPVLGCVDQEACNFNAEAAWDDGSCIPSGCMDSQACNFNPEAECQGEACNYTCCPGPGCCSIGHYWDWDLEKCFDLVPSDTDFDGCVSMTDLLDLLTVFGTCAEEEPEEDPEVAEWSCGDPLEYQGYDYETVQIGEQCWFAENLRATSYQNGDAIPTGSSLADWDEASGQGYQVAYGGLPAAICEDFSTTIDACDPAQSLDTYGLLYNNFAVTDSRGICPQGWHVGTDEDWGEFEVFLGMDEATVFTEGFRGTNQGTMIKTTTGWQNNGSGTDEVGFHGHPSGGIAPDQDRFGNGGSDAVWWTPSETNGLDRRRSMNDYNDGIRRGTLSPTSGAAIRCLQD